MRWLLFVLLGIALAGYAGYGDCSPCGKKPPKVVKYDREDEFAPPETGSWCEADNAMARKKAMDAACYDKDYSDFAEDMDRMNAENQGYDKAYDIETDQDKKSHAKTEKNAAYNEKLKHTLKDTCTSESSGMGKSNKNKKANIENEQKMREMEAEKAKAHRKQANLEGRYCRDADKGFCYEDEDAKYYKTPMPRPCPPPSRPSCFNPCAAPVCAQDWDDDC